MDIIKNKSRKQIFYVAISLNLITYFLYLNYFTYFTPDEVWYAEIMQNGFSISSPSPFHASLFNNNLGYGAAFWLFGHFVFLVTPFDFLVSLRVVFLGINLFSLLLMMDILKKKNSNNDYLFAAISTLPLFLFVIPHKIITVEPIIVFLGLTAIWISNKFSSKHTIYLVMSVLGFAIGLKINFFIPLLFIAAFALWDYQKKFRLSPQIILLCFFAGLLGFIISNPQLLWTTHFLSHLPKQSFSIIRKASLIDFNFNVIPWFSLFLFFFIFYRSNKRLFKLLIALTCLHLLFSCFTYSYYWHLVPIILFIFVLFFKSVEVPLHAKDRLAFLIIIFLNLGTSLWHLKRTTYPILKTSNEIKDSLSLSRNQVLSFTQSSKYDYVFVDLFVKELDVPLLGIMESSLGNNVFSVSSDTEVINYVIYPLNISLSHTFWRNREVKEKLESDMQNKKPINLLYIYNQDKGDEAWLDSKLPYLLKSRYSNGKVVFLKYTSFN